MPPVAVEKAIAAKIDGNTLWLRGGFPDSVTAASDEDSYVWRQAFIRSIRHTELAEIALRAIYIMELNPAGHPI